MKHHQPPAMVRVRISSLTGAEYNPKSRVDEKYVADLVAAMTEVGQLVPILVTPTGNIIDGHRRVAALKLMGREHVDAIQTTADPERAYASVNSASKRLSGADRLSVYLEAPRAVEGQSRFDRMVEVIGYDLARRLSDFGGSIRTYQQAVQVANHVGDNSPEYIRTILAWIMDKRQTYQVRRALDNGVSAKIFKDAIARNRSLKNEWRVA